MIGERETLSRWWRHDKNKLFPSRDARVSWKTLSISPRFASREEWGEKVKSRNESTYGSDGKLLLRKILKFRMFQGCCAKAHLTKTAILECDWAIIIQSLPICVVARDLEIFQPCGFRFKQENDLIKIKFLFFSRIKIASESFLRHDRFSGTLYGDGPS